jgi:hypothetical protein
MDALRRPSLIFFRISTTPKLFLVPVTEDEPSIAKLARVRQDPLTN